MRFRKQERIFWIAILLLFLSSLPGLAQTVPEEQTAPRITLEELIREAEANNPELRAAADQRQAARRRVQPAGALPDPVFRFGQMNTGNLLPLTALGDDEMARLSFEVEQEFPLFGKRALREQLAAKEADAEWWHYESVRLRLLSQLKIAYYELYLQHRSLESLQNNMRLLETFAETAAAMYRVGQAAQADLLRAQTELTRLQEQIELAEQRKQRAESEIRSLLNRPPDWRVPEPAAFATAVFERPYDELLQLAVERFPLLRQQRDIIASRQLAVALAEKERRPDLGVMFAYHNRGGLKDLWEFGGMLRIPLYFARKQKHEIEAAALDLSAAQQQEASLRAAVQFNLKDAYLEATTSQRLLRLLEQTIIPQETLTLESTSASYQVGAVESLAVLTSMVQLTNDQIRYYEYLTRFHQALARMEPLVGEELTR